MIKEEKKEMRRKKMIGIIGAMDEEVADLISHMTDVVETERASMKFYEGKLWGKDAVVVRSGIGKVNAACCAQILVDLFNVEMLINTGIAGSLDPEINIGDVVIGVDAVHHDMDTAALGDPKGQVPRMETFAFPADETLVEKAYAANCEANPDIATIRGRIASGDQFISEDGKKKEITEIFGAKCAEMEGAAISHIAYLNHIPCVVIRSISDKADNSAEMDYPTFAKLAIGRSVRLMEVLIGKL